MQNGTTTTLGQDWQHLDVEKWHPLGGQKSRTGTNYLRKNITEGHVNPGFVTVESHKWNLENLSSSLAIRESSGENRLVWKLLK